MKLHRNWIQVRSSLEPVSRNCIETGSMPIQFLANFTKPDPISFQRLASFREGGSELVGHRFAFNVFLDIVSFNRSNYYKVSPKLVDARETIE